MLSADWVSVYVEAAAAIGTIGAFTVGMVLLHNASDMPIYEVSLPRPDESRDEAEFIGLVPPGQTIQRPAPREWLPTYYAPEPVEIEFLDSSGRQWSRTEQGFLSLAGDDDSPERPARRRFRPFRGTR